jgi:hypothetical protein
MIRFEEIKEHTCKPLVATCPHDGCEAQIMIDTKDSHWDQCPEVIIACKLCSQTHLRKNAVNHQKECPEVKISCQQCN